MIDSYNNKVLERIGIDSIGITEGGSSIEEESSIKFRAPREYASQSRCVVSEDYETLVRRVFPAVDAVYAYGGETLPIPEYGRVYVVIKPTTGDKLSNLTKRYIKDSLDPFRVASLDINIIDPLILNIELDSQVYYDELKTRKDSYAIKSLINEINRDLYKEISSNNSNSQAKKIGESLFKNIIEIGPGKGALTDEIIKQKPKTRCFYPIRKL